MPRKNCLIIGEPLGGEPQEERKHFMKCYDCGRLIDMRNVDDVMAHERACDGALAPPPHWTAVVMKKAY